MTSSKGQRPGRRTISDALDVVSTRMVSRIEDAETPMAYESLPQKGKAVVDGLIRRRLVRMDKEGNLWARGQLVGKSPSGYPDDYREPPKETNMVENYRKEPHVDEGAREVWKFWVGCAAVMVMVVCATFISIIWPQVPPQVRTFIIAVPYGLLHGNRIVWMTTMEGALVIGVALRWAEFRDGLRKIPTRRLVEVLRR